MKECGEYGNEHNSIKKYLFRENIRIRDVAFRYSEVMKSVMSVMKSGRRSQVNMKLYVQLVSFQMSTFYKVPSGLFIQQHAWLDVLKFTYPFTM